MDLRDTYRMFHAKATEYALCSAVHRTFSKIDRICVYKGSLNKYKKTEITSCNLLEHNEIKLEINKKLQKIFKHMQIEQFTSIMISGSLKK
jgi:hypothetical protein